MELKPKPPSMKGPSAWFTGEVWIDPIARGDEPSKLSVSAVRFTPGARTAWHSHSTGQTLWVTDGAGLVQPRDGGCRGGHAKEPRCGLAHTPAPCPGRDPMREPVEHQRSVRRHRFDY